MSFINHKAVCVAALSLLAFGRPAGAQAVSEARVQELLAQARAQVQQPAQRAAATPAPAATTIDLTMEQAVAKAVDQNIDLTVARLGPQIQNFNFLQAKGAFAPTVSSTVGEYARSSISTNTLSGGQTVDQKTTTYNAALSQPLPWWGGTASVNWTNTRGSSNSTISTYNPNYNSLFTAQLVQPLLRNRKIDTNRQTLLTSEISRRLADVTLRATTINTIANTRNAYWELVYAVQAVEVARQSLDLANRLVEDNKAKVEIGTLAPLDVVSAQSEAASRQLALVQAVATRQTSELTLKRLLVAGTSDPLWTAALNPTDRPPAVPEKIDVESALRQALASRTDLIQARENLKSTEISLNYYKNQIMPALDLTAYYGASGTGGPYITRSSATGGAATSITPGGYWDALSMVGKVKLPTWNVSVTLSYPLGFSAQKARFASYRVQREQSVANLRSLELKVATDITNAAITVNNDLEQVQASGAARELAQKKLEAAQSKFEVGMATNYEVVQAQRDLSDAQNSELRAVLNYRKALVDFQRLQETSSSGGSSSSSSASSSSSY